MTKMLYYLTRDFIHLGKIEPLMRDKLIEDISCDGAGIPIYIWYRDYESIPTNISFETNEELDTFVSKLAYSAGKHVSLAEPIVDASLTDGSRLHLTYGKEITQKGSTFTIRKFRVDPLTIVDLIKYNTLSSDVAAYLWYLIEKKLALLVAGGTASGKSIPHDEKVLAYKDGKQVLVSIGDLFDEMVAVRSSTKNGVYETVDCDNLQTAAFSSKLTVERSDVKSVIRHPAPDSIYVLRTRSGRTVRATGDHSIFTITDGRVTPFPTSRVTQGMFVAVPRSIPDSPSPSRMINLLAILAKAHRPLYVENVAGHVQSAVERLGEDEVSRILGLRPRSVREGVRAGFLTARVDKFLDLAAVTNIPVKTEGLWIRSKTNRNFKLRADLPMTKPLARFLGYWTAEGVYQEKGVSLFQLDPLTRTDMLDSASTAFGVTGHGNMGDRTRMDFNSSVVMAVLKGIFGEGSGAGAKRIPEVIFGGSNELMAEFLRGYFTGDASAGSVIEASTKSRELAYQLLYALSRFAIVARVSPKTVKGRKYYRVSIFGQPNLRRFEENIGFLDTARQSKLRHAVLARIQPHTNVDTIPGIAPLLKEALAFKHGKEKKEVWSDWHSYWSPTKRKSIGRETLVSFVKETGAQSTVEQRLSALAYSDIFWDEVVDVEKVDYRGKYVYDLEVPGAQNFVGGSGGIFLHNTTTLNALSMFIEPGEKIVSVEDTPELNLPHENWIQSVTRGVGTAGEITMFDLLKASLRQRPDVLIVGEVRGEEAFTLLQSIASVTGDTEVLVRRHGMTTLTKIGELVDGAYKGDGERIPVSMHGVEVLTFDSQNRIVYAPVQYALRHRASEIYSIHYAGGIAHATGSHSVFVFDDDGDLVTRAVKDLRKEDVMVSFCGSETPRVPPVVKPREILSSTEPERIILSREKATCPRCGSAKTIRKGRYYTDWRYFCNNCKRIFNGVTQPVVLHNTLLQPDGTVLVAFSRSKTLPEEIPVDEEFAEVLGIYMADGCVKHDGKASRVVFCLGKGEKEIFAGVLKGFFSRFEVTPTIDDRDTYVILDFNHTLLAKLFDSLCGAKLSEKHLPEFIWSAPPSLVVSFLEGWKADARRKTKRKDVSYSSARPDLVRSISWLARMNGMTSFISERSSKYQSVYTSSNKAAKNRAIPARPLLKLKRLLDSTAWRYVPSARAKTTRKAVAGRALDEILAKRRAQMTEESQRLAHTIRNLIDGSMIACRILNMERSAFDGFVYDLSVPDTEAFFGGESPVALHNTGHGGLGTIHADSVEAVINRLTTEPMNIPRSLVGTTLDCIVMQLKLRMADKSVRRVVAVTEVVGHDPRTDEIILNDAFKWDPVLDKFSYTGRSKLFDKITQKFGTRPEEIRREIDGRKTFLDWLAAKNIRSHGEVSEQVKEFYAGPYAVINKAKVELEGLKA